MKKIVSLLLTAVMLTVPAHAMVVKPDAMGITHHEVTNSPVAVKTEEGVFLSWPYEGEEEYNIYRNNTLIATTDVTNYTDLGADGTAEYKINSTDVKVWNKNYLEVPISIPTPYTYEPAQLKYVDITTSENDSIPLGHQWTIFPRENGYVVLIDEAGKCLDVENWKVDPGSTLGCYAYNNSNNQRFMLEKEGKGYYIKGEQSNLYVTIGKDARVTIEKKENASLFYIEEKKEPVPENIEKMVYDLTFPPSYGPGDASVGDLDGDGEWEIVLKWDPSNAKDAAHGGESGKVIIDAYELDGTLMWRVDMGVNIRAGAHDTQFLVYDFDGDGKAEVATRISDGTTDGVGNIIGDITKRWIDGGGRNLEGPLWLAVFDGTTGEMRAKTDFYPQNTSRETSTSFGDGYGNRSERYNAAVAYVDGKTPHIIFQRGYYARTTVAAYTFKNNAIEKVWHFDTAELGDNPYMGQGNHNISIADADRDGKDEIFLGSLALDHDGSVLWCSGKGHGDAMHLGDFDPENEGLEFFSVHEWGPFGYTIYDAASGDMIYDIPGAKDTGRGIIANVGPFGGSYIVNVGSGARRINSLGEAPKAGDYGNNFRIYWDGDLYDELMGGTGIVSYTIDGKDNLLLDAYKENKSQSINGSKGTPCLSADIFGDWREEVIFKSEDNTKLHIYTTTIPTDFAMPSPMTDHVYRMGITWQNSSYNQPPHLGYNPEIGLRLWIDKTQADMNGMKLEVDAAPYILNGRTMVPLRFIAELFDFDVQYENGTVKISKNNSLFETVIGTRKYTMNGVEKEMDAESVIVNDRTMVPVRVIAEAFGMKVNWDGEERVVTVSRGGEKEDYVTIFALADINQAQSIDMLHYFFDKTVSFKKVNSVDEIIGSAESGDYAVVFNGEDVAELTEMGVNIVNAQNVLIDNTNTRTTFDTAGRIAELIYQYIDGASRKINGYAQTVTFKGENEFNVALWGNSPYYRVTLEGNAKAEINGETALVWEIDGKSVSYVDGPSETITVTADGEITATVEPCEKKEQIEFKAPADMTFKGEVAGIVKYENDNKATIFNSTDEPKKVRVGNTVIKIEAKSSITYDKKVIR